MTMLILLLVQVRYVSIAINCQEHILSCHTCEIIKSFIYIAFWKALFNIGQSIYSCVYQIYTPSIFRCQKYIIISGKKPNCIFIDLQLCLLKENKSLIVIILNTWLNKNTFEFVDRDNFWKHLERIWLN